MVFSVGETVVYPHHGAALIEAIETRVVKGEEKQYLVLRVAQGDLTVRVPAENAEIVGVREVVGEEGLTQGLRRPPRSAHRGADQLVAALQGESGEAGLRQPAQGR